MGPYIEPNILSWVIFFPLGTALALLGTRVLAALLFGAVGAPGIVWRAIAMGGSTITFLLALVLLLGFDPEVLGPQGVEHIPWLPDLGIHYAVGVDGISLVLILLTTFIVPLALLSSWKEIDSSLKSYVVLLLFLETGVIGSFASTNLFLLYMFWEMTLIASYFLIGRWGSEDRFRAATRSILFGLLGSLLLFSVILVVHRLNFEQSGIPNFDLFAPPGGGALALLDTMIAPTASAESIWWQTQPWLLGVFLLGYGIRSAVIPLHSWFTESQTESSTPSAILISALLVQLGAYVFVRVALPLFHTAAVSASPGLSVVAVVGLVYAAILTLAQRDLRRLVAYSTLAQLALIFLGILTLKLHGLVGAILQMLSHGLSVAALLMLFGFLAERRKTRSLDEFGGIAKPMPVYAAMLAVVLGCHAGLPALSGFVGQFLILLGSGARSWVITAAAVLGLTATAIALFSAYRRVALGPLDEPANRGLIDLDWRERSVVFAVLIPIIWIGVHPGPLLRRVEPTASDWLRRVEAPEVVYEISADPLPDSSAHEELELESASPPTPIESGDGSALEDVR